MIINNFFYLEDKFGVLEVETLPSIDHGKTKGLHVLKNYKLSVCIKTIRYEFLLGSEEARQSSVNSGLV